MVAPERSFLVAGHSRHLQILLLSLTATCLLNADLPEADGTIAGKAGEHHCSCMLQWILRAGIPESAAKRYETIIDNTGLSLSNVAEMNAAVFGLLLHGNRSDARNIQICFQRISPSCNNYNPCKTGGLCLQGSKEQVSTCRCTKGLTGCLCETDVDECQARDTNECDEPKRAICTNTHGSYVCSCRRGYGGNGRHCADINECTTGLHRCHVQGECNNTVGNYTCSCTPPYNGNGYECKIDLCADEENSSVCQEVKILRDKVDILQETIEQQRDQTSLLTTAVTEFLERTGKLDRKLTREAGHLRSGLIDLSSRCKGIYSWKHFNKYSSSHFASWEVNFNKERNDTSLRVSYSGSLGMYGYNSGAFYCTQVQILFNDSECSDPAPITSSFVYRKNTGNWYTYSLAPSMITGHCNQLISGSIAIKVSISNVCSTSSVHNYNGDSPGGVGTYSLNVEEFCS